MYALLRPTFVAALLLFSLQLIGPGEDPKAPAIDSGLATADQLYREGKFAEAEASYEALLKTDSKLVPAHVGLVRAMLRQQKIDEAFEVVNAALAAHSSSAALLAAKGDVQFRRGEMSEAEKSYLGAEKIDPKEVRAHLGLAQVYRSFSLYGRAYVHLQIAHQIAPDDFAVEVAWLNVLPQKQRLAAIESYLNNPHPDIGEQTKTLTAYLESLKGTIDNPIHACRLVSNVEQTDTPLEALHGRNESQDRVRVGMNLSTKINNQNVLLQLDTGASGIVLNRRVAEKTGVSRLSAAYARGIGDQGARSGYRGLAEHVQIGDLEFQDCVVLVTDLPSRGPGFIGTDVFGSYLVDIDLPKTRLRLSPLPKRPEDPTAATWLNSEAEDPANAEQPERSTAGPRSTGQSASPLAPPPSPRLPRDRYIAPEMVNWTQVFRFGNIFLVPTSVNGSKPLLFVLDTGSPNNVLSVRAGQLIGKVRSEDRMRVTGMSGNAKQVYSSDKASLRFGHFEQPNNYAITLDLSAMNRQNGTEVSGFLGFQVLQLLEVKLDYRDGLVDFEYSHKHTK